VSIMLRTVTVNTSVPCIMVSDKATDVINKDWLQK